MASESSTLSVASGSIIFILGAPGSGKGTLCKLISSKASYYHLSVGDFLRDFVNTTPTEQHGAYGYIETIKSHLESHTLVPPKAIVNLLRWKLSRLREEGFEKVLLDGFPRDRDSAELFLEVVGKPETVLLFECPKEICKERFLVRAREKSDTVEVFDKRFAEYESNMRGILEVFENSTGMVRFDTSQDTGVSQLAVEKFFGVD